MKFSVVIPLYNKEQYILRAVSSILNQTYTDFELVVIDDGSVDDGPNLVSRVRDPRIRVIRQENGGEAAARNRGIEEAREAYIAFLDADDAWEENHLSTLAQLIDDFPDAGLYCTGYQFIEPSGKVKVPNWFNVPDRGYVGRYFLSVSGGDMVATASSVCIPREVFREVGSFPVGDQLGADQDMWARVALRHPIAVDARPTATYFRDASNRSCVNLKSEGELPYITRLQSALDTTCIPDEMRGDIEAYIRQALFSLISTNVRNRRFKAAQKLLQDPRLQGIGLRLRIWTILANLPPSLSDLTLRAVDSGRAAFRSVGGVARRHNA